MAVSLTIIPTSHYRFHRGKSISTSASTVEANLIISFPFFTFIPKQSILMLRTSLSIRRYECNKASKLQIENEFTPIHMTATDKPSLQISLPQIFSVSQSKFAICYLLVILVLILIVCLCICYARCTVHGTKHV